MENLDTYWTEYGGNYLDGTLTPNGYTCPNCGAWVCPGANHYCTFHYPHTLTYYPTDNKTEKAFKILKLLVKEKIIQEPTSLKGFCGLIEKIAKVA